MKNLQKGSLTLLVIAIAALLILGVAGPCLAKKTGFYKNSASDLNTAKEISNDESSQETINSEVTTGYIKTCVASQAANFVSGKYAPGNIIVGFKSDVSFEIAKSILTNLGYKYTKEEWFSGLHFLMAIVPVGGEAEAVCRISANSGVAFAEPDRIQQGHTN